MNVLVFGKDGQLGKAFQVVLGALAIKSADMPHILFVGRSESDLLDVVSLHSLLTQYKPKLIINASAYTSVDQAEAEIESAFAINAKAPEIMAKYAADHDATFLHYSTDYVFDGEKYGFYLEDDLRNPLGVYGKSKAAGEEAIARVFAGIGGNGQYAIFRTSWLYGDGSNFIRTILRLAKEHEELKIVHNHFGVPTSANWLAQVSLHFALDEHACLRKFTSGIYHAVPTGETTWHGLASLAVQAALDAGATLKANRTAIQPILAEEYPLPAPRPMNSRMSSDKLHQVFSGRSDMSKLMQLSQPWDEAVRSYVTNLAKDGLI